MAGERIVALLMPLVLVSLFASSSVLCASDVKISGFAGINKHFTGLLESPLHSQETYTLNTPSGMETMILNFSVDREVSLCVEVRFGVYPELELATPGGVPLCTTSSLSVLVNDVQSTSYFLTFYLQDTGRVVSTQYTFIAMDKEHSTKVSLDQTVVREVEAVKSVKAVQSSTTCPVVPNNDTQVYVYIWASFLIGGGLLLGCLVALVIWGRRTWRELKEGNALSGMKSSLKKSNK